MYNKERALGSGPWVDVPSKLKDYVAANSLRKPLLEDEQRELITIIVKNESPQEVARAKDKLTRSLLKFILQVAIEIKQSTRTTVSVEDLFNEGYLGLNEAFGKFNSEHESRASFLFYASWWIKQAMRVFIKENDHSRTGVRMPANAIAANVAFKKIYNELEEELGRPPTEDEILTLTEEKGISLTTVNKLLSLGAPVSLQQKTGGEQDNTWLDVIENSGGEMPGQSLDEESLKKEIFLQLATLKANEAKIITLYFGLGEEPPKTLDEIAGMFGITRERVRQIKKKALKNAILSNLSAERKSYLQAVNAYYNFALL